MARLDQLCSVPSLKSLQSGLQTVHSLLQLANRCHQGRYCDWLRGWDRYWKVNAGGQMSEK